MSKLKSSKNQLTDAAAEYEALRESARQMEKLRDWVMGQPWFDPVQMVGRLVTDVTIEEISRLRVALQIIADGTLCPDLFPTLDVEKDVWEMQAKTAMTSAIAALERDSAALESRDG